MSKSLGHLIQIQSGSPTPTDSILSGCAVGAWDWYCLKVHQDLLFQMFHIGQWEKHQILQTTLRQLRKHTNSGCIKTIYKPLQLLSNLISGPSHCLYLSRTYHSVTLVVLFSCVQSSSHRSGPGCFPVHKTQLRLHLTWKAFHESSGCACCHSLRSP